MTDIDKTDLNDQWLSAQDEEPSIELPKCDFDKYREYIEDFDLSVKEQNELLETLWTIMAAFVDLGFGVDSIQLLQVEDLKEPNNSKGVRYDNE